MQNKLLFLALNNIYLVVLILRIQRVDWEVASGYDWAPGN